MTQPRRRRREPSPQQLSARTLQILGVVLIVGTAIFWAFTNRESALLMGAGITLATLGWLQRAFVTFQSRVPTYDDEEEHPESEEYLLSRWDREHDRPEHEAGERDRFR